MLKTTQALFVRYILLLFAITVHRIQNTRPKNDNHAMDENYIAWPEDFNLTTGR